MQPVFDNKEGNALSQQKLVAKSDVSLDSVSNILECEEKYLHDYEMNQKQNWIIQQLDDQISDWFVEQRITQISISRPISFKKKIRVMSSFETDVQTDFMRYFLCLTPNLTWLLQSEHFWSVSKVFTSGQFYCRIFLMKNQRFIHKY